MHSNKTPKYLDGGYPLGGKGNITMTSQGEW